MTLNKSGKVSLKGKALMFALSKIKPLTNINDIQSLLNPNILRKIFHPVSKELFIGKFNVNKIVKKKFTNYYINCSKESKKIIFFIHGGGHSMDIASSHWWLIRKIIKKTNISFCVPIYPLSPENKFNVIQDSILKSYLHISESNKEKEIIIMGDSSGGNLALLLSKRLERIKNSIRPSKIVLLSPWLDLSLTNPYIKNYELIDPILTVKIAIKWARLYAPGIDLKSDKISPLYIKKLPNIPIIVFAGENDILFPDIIKLEERMRESDILFTLISYKGLPHDFILYDIPETKRCVDLLASFIE